MRTVVFLTACVVFSTTWAAGASDPKNIKIGDVVFGKLVPHPGGLSTPPATVKDLRLLVGTEVDTDRTRFVVAGTLVTKVATLKSEIVITIRLMHPWTGAERSGAPKVSLEPHARGIAVAHIKPPIPIGETKFYAIAEPNGVYAGTFSYLVSIASVWRGTEQVADPE